MTDFPAAHSMDTHWFAMDAEGNLAVFDSGENGAIPYFIHDDIRIPSSKDIEDFFKIFMKDEKGIITLEIDGEIFFKENGLTPVPRSIFNNNGYFYLLLVLSSEEAISKLKSPHNLIVRFAGDSVVVYVDECSKKIIESMLDSGEILGGKDFRLEENFHNLGLFYYRTCDGMPTPYERREVPAKPLRVEDLPEELQIALCTSHFENIHFVETEIIQPIEHSKCRTWKGDDEWIDSQGNKRKGFDHLINELS